MKNTNQQPEEKEVIVDLGAKFGKVKMDFQNMLVADYELLASGEAEEAAFPAMKAMLIDCVVSSKTGKPVFSVESIGKLRLRELTGIVQKIMSAQSEQVELLKKK